MKTLEQLNAEIKDCNSKMQSILDAADKDNGGKLNEAQKAEYAALETQYDALLAEKKEVAEAVEKRKKLADRSKQSGDLDKAIGPPKGRVTQPDPIGGLSVEENFLKDPKRGFETPRDFMLCVMETNTSGRLEDPRLKSLAAGSDENSTVSDPYGGFLLPKGFSPNLLSLGAEGDPTAGRTTAVPMTTQTLEIPARVDKNHTSSVSGGLRVYRRNETDTSSSSRMEFEQVKLAASMLFGLAYATEELLARSPISFVALLEAGFNDEFAAKILKEKLFGTGAGQYEGVVNSPCTVSQAKETGQVAATIVYENIIKMRSRCWRYGDAVWLANHDTLPHLMVLNLAVGTGGVPIWHPSAVEDAPDMLLGRPLFFSEFAETVGTQGDIILGNWTQYLEGTLSGPQQDESVHVRFINHERTFKFWMENDGRCWWRTALTPNQSSTTLSPFVVLDTRA